MNKLRKVTFFPVLLFIIISCVTINIYFPAAAVEKAADEIVQETWGEKGNGPPPEKKEKEGLLDHWYKNVNSAIGVTAAYAQEADIDVTTPAIRALKQSISDRSGSIKPYMDSGNVGIGNDGLLVIRSTDGLNLKGKADVRRLVSAENRDRESLYLEIAQANNFGADRVPDIKRIFAGSWVRNARGGWWVQDASGAWGRK
jgi:uncharacterized protein YdbL (DUF1318 family)